jgi:hypothetical protein
LTVHDLYGNAVALWHKPPKELLRLGKDMQAVLRPGNNVDERTADVSFAGRQLRPA